MATIMSTGQITLVDLTDQRPVSFYLQANQSKIQVYDVNKKSYTPDYGTSTLEITPHLFFGNDDSTSQLTSSNLTYTVNDTPITGNITGITQVGNVLKITMNLNSGGAPFNKDVLKIVASIKEDSITDNNTGITIENVTTADIEFVKVNTGADGSTGIGIESITVYYNSNNTQETAPTTWKTNLNEVASLSSTNKYLWSYQTTKYTSGDEDSTTPAIIGVYGDTGQTGAAGRSVQSITEQYYISTSKDSATGGTWSSTPPSSLNSNQYLWTRTEIVYKNSDNTTSTEYKPSEGGSVDYTWNLAVDEITKMEASFETLREQQENLQNQIDGSIDTWYGEIKPEIDKEPSSNWTDDNEKIRHNGDLYYNTATGAAFRYIVEASNGVVTSERWVAITDAALTDALQQIQDIGAVVDKKMTIYYNEISSPPASAEVGDLWIQGLNGDYYKCTTSYSSGISSTNWPNYWTLANQNIGKVDILFAKNASSTVAPADNEFTTTSPTWEEGKYIWQKTVTYSKDGVVLTESDPVCITSASRSIDAIINYYLASASSSGVTTSTSGWDTDITKAVLSKDKPYLWNYERVTYTYGSDSVSNPIIIGNYSSDGATGEAGRGITGVTEYYLLTATNDTPTFDKTTWSTTMPKATDDEPYLWNVEVVTYNKAPLEVESDPQLIGYRGIGIKSVKVYYKTNNSETTAPTSGWTETWTDVTSSNQFLWSYTETTYTDNTTSSSKPAIIARYTKDGDDAVFAVVESTSGKVIFTDSDSSNITLRARLYVGGAEVSLSANSYAWTSIPSGISTTGSTLTVTRDNVPSARSFMCSITYNGVVYRHSIALSDKTDPIYAVIESSNGDKFTNGDITTTLKCRVFDGNGELDVDGTKYYYTWEKHDSKGDPVEGWLRDTKSFEVSAADVNSKATFTCTVTKKPEEL